MLTKASRSLERRWGLYLYRCHGLEVRRRGVGTLELPCVRSHWGSLELQTKVHNRNSKLFLDAVFVNSLRGDDSEMYQGYNNKMTKVVLAITIFSHDLLGSPLRAALLTPLTTYDLSRDQFCSHQTIIIQRWIKFQKLNG